MNKTLMVTALLAAFAAAPMAQASTATYNITTTWFEPDTQPRDSIFIGSFTYDDVTHSVTNLQGSLSESMTGNPLSSYDYGMTWIPLTYQLQTWHDDALGGTLAAVFAKNTTATFYGGTWTPQDGVDVGGIFDGYTIKNWQTAYDNSIQNAYALIFVPDSLTPAYNLENPLTLSWNESAGTGSLGLASTAYGDCAPGGMMGPVCMTATSEHVYGSVGTMSGYPISQTIAAVPEPESYAMFLAGLGLMGTIARRRKATT